MPDYKELYLTMVRETEKAITILIQAQQACEEAILADCDFSEVKNSLRLE